MQLQPYEDELKALDVQVAVVTFANQERAELYVKETSLSWPLLLDEDRNLYQAYGMESAGWGRLAGPASMWTYLKLVAKGRKIKSPTEDVHQLGGDILIDPEGIVRLHHTSDNPADRPEVETLLEIVRKQKTAS